jgi:hypothetical protein
VPGCASALRRCSAGPRLVGVRGVEAGQNLTGKEQCHAATGHDTFLVCPLGRVHRVVDAVLALLDLDLAAATNADDSDAARQLTRAFTPYFRDLTATAAGSSAGSSFFGLPSDLSGFEGQALQLGLDQRSRGLLRAVAVMRPCRGSWIVAFTRVSNAPAAPTTKRGQSRHLARHKASSNMHFESNRAGKFV